MAAVGEEKFVDGQSRKQTRRKISGAGRTTSEKENFRKGTHGGPEEKFSERDGRQAKKKVSAAGRTAGENREKTGGQENGGRRFFGEATNSGENGKERCEKIASEQIVEGETKEFSGWNRLWRERQRRLFFGGRQGRDKEGALGRIEENKA